MKEELDYQTQGYLQGKGEVSKEEGLECEKANLTSKHKQS